MNGFPQLPIIQPDPPPAPRKTQAEKYGGLLYLGAGGLVVLVLLIAYFSYGLWSHRTIWTNVYVLNDPRRPEVDRLNAALRLTRDPLITPRQLWDLSLSRTPPPLGRYLITEGMTSAVVADDPRAYALSVARSEGWPDWLRMGLARPMAYAAAEGESLPLDVLDELKSHEDPCLRLWVEFMKAVSKDGDAAARDALESASKREGPLSAMARELRTAARAKQPERNEALDRASRLVRQADPDVADLWERWEERGGRIVPRSAPELPPQPR